MKENTQKTTHSDATFQQGISEVAVKHRGTRITNTRGALYHIELVIHIYREILAPRSDSMCYKSIGLYPDATVESHGTSGCSLIGLFPHPAPEPRNEASK